MVEQLVEDFHVVGEQGQVGVGQARPGEDLVGASRGLDQAHRGLVDLFHRLVALEVLAAHQGNLAVHAQGLAEEGLLLALQGHRDAADGDVALLALEVRHQALPGGVDPLHPDPEALGQGLGQADVDALVVPVVAQVAVGLVVAGGADRQVTAFQHLVQA